MGTEKQACVIILLLLGNSTWAAFTMYKAVGTGSCGDSYKTLAVVSLLRCAAVCAPDTLCLGFNFKDGVCQLHQKLTYPDSTSDGSCYIPGDKDVNDLLTTTTIASKSTTTVPSKNTTTIPSKTTTVASKYNLASTVTSTTKTLSKTTTAVPTKTTTVAGKTSTTTKSKTTTRASFWGKG
ncbi:uncharacterized protein [Penaeus vannamei]|uniref:uncharacterized protein n=1 Tax=Penaeus vannamei TaxID=6689 RepID=UPI00387F5AB0